MRNSGECPRGGAATCKRCAGKKGAVPNDREAGSKFQIMVTDKSGGQVEWEQACWDKRNTGQCPRGGAPECRRCAGTVGATPSKCKGKGMGGSKGKGKGKLKALGQLISML